MSVTGQPTAGSATECCRFSVLSMLVGIAAAAVLCALNMRATETVTEPEYAPLMGAVRHPPPYEMKEMAVTVHSDRGWPLWHTRASNHFAAHNAGAYLREGGPPYERASPETSIPRVAIDSAAGLLLVVASVALCEMIVRSRRVASQS